MRAAKDQRWETSAEGVRGLLSESAGLGRKRAIGPVVEILRKGYRNEGWPEPLGEDAAAIPHSEGYLLLAADSIGQTLLRDPFWAGYCSVLVNVNDVAAMGGGALALVNVLIGADEARRRRIAEGISFGSRHFHVPMVGGHLHPDGLEAGVAVAVLGRAERLIDSFGARPGHEIVFAVDLEGDWHESFAHWDTTTRRTPEEIQAQLAVMPELSRRGLVAAGKDVSNPGFLGTLLMLMETSGVGAAVDVEALPRPGGMPWGRWLRCYPGHAYVLAVSPEAVPRVRTAFEEAGMAASSVGVFVRGSELQVPEAGHKPSVWNWALEPVTGISARKTSGPYSSDTHS